MPIHRVCVASCAGIWPHTCACIASIRRWHPEVPLDLYVDDTDPSIPWEEMTEAWQVRVCRPQPGDFQRHYRKWQPMMDHPDERLLILDGDTIMMGRVLDVLGGFSEDFVVVQEDTSPENSILLYYDLNLMKRFDPGFRPPDFRFNTGQFVARGGAIPREVWTSYIDATLSHALDRTLFPVMDQSIMNYILPKALQEGRITLRRHPFMHWAFLDWKRHRLAPKRDLQGKPRILHWAGYKSNDFRQMPNGHLLSHYFAIYHRRIPWGFLKHPWRLWNLRKRADPHYQAPVPRNSSCPA
jgi:hypothetical protein